MTEAGQSVSGTVGQGGMVRRHPRLISGLLVVLLGIAALVFVPGWLKARQAAVTPYPHELAQVSFTVAGDVIPHEAVRASAAAAGEGEKGWESLFSAVADVFQRADFGFVNLETPVAPAHSHGTKPFLFDAPPALLDALKASGIKIVSFANNHAMDQGWAGFAETREHLTEKGLLFAGTGDTKEKSWQPVFTDARGIRVGWLGMTRWLNGGRNPEKDDVPHVNFFPYSGEPGGETGANEAQVLEAVKQARAQCDFLVVSIHWGVEYAPAPRPEDVELAHRMLDAGAGVIVGHHPHVLQPVEHYQTQDGRNAVIFYSLGNFLSNQSREYVDALMPDREGDPRDELIAQFSVVKKDYGPAGMKVELGHVGILPVWGENNRNEIARGQAKNPVIRPVLIDRELPRLQAKLDELNRLSLSDSQEKAAKPEEGSAPKTLTETQQKEFVSLTRQVKLLIDRRALLLNRTGDAFLAEPPKGTGKP